MKPCNIVLFVSIILCLQIHSTHLSVNKRPNNKKHVPHTVKIYVVSFRKIYAWYNSVQLIKDHTLACKHCPNTNHAWPFLSDRNPNSPCGNWYALGWKALPMRCSSRASQYWDNVWKSRGGIMVNGVPREVPGPKPKGPQAPRGLAEGTNIGRVKFQYTGLGCRKNVQCMPNGGFLPV